MSGNTSKNRPFGEDAAPDRAGLDHIWLPYTQMKTASPPLAVVATLGSRIMLADGRELIDGVASWWTACHGYNHPHIRERGRAPAQNDAARHARRFGARAGVDASRSGSPRW